MPISPSFLQWFPHEFYHELLPCCKLLCALFFRPAAPPGVYHRASDDGRLDLSFPCPPGFDDDIDTVFCALSARAMAAMRHFWASHWAAYADGHYFARRFTAGISAWRDGACHIFACIAA